MVKEVCHAEVLEKSISYQITLGGRAWPLKTYGAPLARESSGESFFLRILYRSFSFSKVSKSSTTATKYTKYKIKKVQTLESISREQDVIFLSWPIIIFHMLFRFIGGRAEYSEAKRH